MRLIGFTKYGARAASTRQRLLQYIPFLEEAGIRVEHRALLDDDYVRSLSTGEAYSSFNIAKAYARRLFQLLRARRADVIWVYAELFPYLPGLAETLARAARTPVIYDFDDAFFHQYADPAKPLRKALLGRKLEPLLKNSSVCCCGNEYLREYAVQFCERSFILPTVVDTDQYRPADVTPEAGPLCIGWIGSPSTWSYVRPLLPLLSELAATRGVRVRAVGAGVAAVQDRFQGLDLIDWSEEQEIAEVQKMNIGIMPVPDEPWGKGKSGYKLIQYGACGLPVVASPVGVNEMIVKHGETGFLASSLEDWRQALELLLDSPQLRRKLGGAGRTRIEKDYSLRTHAPRLASFIRAATDPAARC